MASSTNAAILQRCLTLPILDQFLENNAEIRQSLGKMLTRIGPTLESDAAVE